MRAHIEPFKRLYQAGKLTDEQLHQRLTDGKITDEEYQYIIEGSTPSPRTDDYKTYYEMTQAILPGGDTNE